MTLNASGAGALRTCENCGRQGDRGFESLRNAATGEVRSLCTDCYAHMKVNGRDWKQLLQSRMQGTYDQPDSN